jgi:arylsulfatase A-like enzyme
VDQADRLALGRHAQRDDRHWPQGIKAKGEIRTQFHHVIDVAATVLDAAGLPEPTFVHGVQQMPLHGVSMGYSFDDAAAAERRETQYFEMFCNRGIYHKGWTAVTRHSTPWVMAPSPPLDQDVWELYAPDDWTQSHDLASRSAREAGRAGSASSSSRRRSTTCCPSTTAASSASTRTWPGVRSSSAAPASCCSAAWDGCRRTRWWWSRTSRTP